ncbi:XRE family transcriptional regulator [Streptomyces sp. RKAG337]|uniref:XRE family transcriptional regulator n=1 Tax=Streptomyces sp. RKAG337 TaxID=2893404 RepID=UPI00203341B3|nr:XRE family transcriptional regulator [Streptomyces sp. RKAG337]MCM2431007.1 XRE family transcriptional regulator [Streptomyces sp. RKAG337]
MSARTTNFRTTVQERRWTFEAFCIQWKRACEELAERDRDPRLATVPMSRRTFDRWMKGDLTERGPRPDTARVLEYLFGMPVGKIFAESDEGPADLPAGQLPAEEPDQAEAVRRRLEGVLTSGHISEAGLASWEETLAWHGRATRFRPELDLLRDLRRDVDALSRALDQRQSLGAMRRLTRFSAQMAGLMSLVLVRQGDDHNAHAWLRVARIAAEEAGDSDVRAWILAEGAYALFYCGDLTGAARAARRAQISGGQPTVGAALAAPLEARAHAVMGDRSEAEAALGRAEDALAQLHGDDTAESAFGYNEAQLRFHQGNALTHLGQTDRAREAQQRALQLYPADEHLDRALIELDGAMCLLLDGEPAAAAESTAEILRKLPEQHRSGIILTRACQLEHLASAAHSGPGPVQVLRDVLTPLQRDTASEHEEKAP